VRLEANTHVHSKTFFKFVSKCQSSYMLGQIFQIKKKNSNRKTKKHLNYMLLSYRNTLGDNAALLGITP
jgi:hypothetical protein